jgi:hypothetical protein
MADGVPIEPGQWHIKTAITMPMVSGERLHEITECIDTDTIDPLKMMGPNNECQIASQNIDGDTVSWEMSCNIDGGQATGTGSFTSEGSTASGTMQIQFNVQGQNMQMDTRWEGKRIGAC